MEGKGKRFFKIIVVIVFVFFSGCAKKQLIRREEVLVDRRSSPLRSVLDVRVVSRDEQRFSLFPQIKNIAFVKDSVRVEELYVHGSEESADVIGILGAAIGFVGCIGGYKYAESGNCLYDGGERIVDGCAISFVSAALGAAIISESGSRGSEFIKIMPGFMKRDTVCLDSIFLIKQKIKVLVEDSDFEETYTTDENGSLELKFGEIIPEPKEADSILSLIIEYGEMVDSVKVKRL